ncbi:NF-kappa-B-repressing factor isoform X1 [Vespula maculifrons]|uniref:NF-kappa-B-repressing factor isoform X1 n=1 Tax=Vespula maculifrons TaxID=7453 RepID=A0ABD2CWG1_VESMC|nr:NF-kappa-B-repressing factor isoform X1 [Vespula vulgaris]XP_050865743.1 NF-kappa-B-repressing factor isoform X1 [Vespula vulgaris]
MNTSTNWDVEQYKAEHESDEHWELRRKFLLAHKDKFPEDELLCLAQVFTNVEILGCRYPKETMHLISELAQDVVCEYRERKKNKLQRTFVKASDAARTKAQGFNNPLPGSTGKTDTCTNNPSSIKSENKIENVPAKKIKLDESPFGDIVLVERPGDLPQTILACAVNVSGGNIEWKINKTNMNKWQCIILINAKQLAESYGTNQKLAKKEASVRGLRELQKYYYTIKIKHNFIEEANVTTTSMLQNTSSHDSISDDNIGKRLMKLMGWTGGGLGKSQQGIVEPVIVKQQVSREGLGLKVKASNLRELELKCRDILKKYLMGDMKTDLVFSPEFSNEERTVIHKLARQMGLKSHSYGPKDQRKLVISRKVDIRDLVIELKTLGGSTDKYELIKPSSV